MAFNQITGIIIKDYGTDSKTEYSCSTNKIYISNTVKPSYNIPYTSLYIFINNNSLHKFEFQFFNDQLSEKDNTLEKIIIELKNIIDKNKNN